MYLRGEVEADVSSLEGFLEVKKTAPPPGRAGAMLQRMPTRRAHLMQEVRR